MFGRLTSRVPAPLGLLLLCVATLSFAWALFTPPWQAPDEPLHYGYVESVAQRGERPGQKPGRIYSTAQSVSLQESNGDKLSQISDGRPQWYDDAPRLFARVAQRDRTDNGGGLEGGSYNKAGENPPAYYLLELLPYAATATVGGVNDRLYVMRLVSALLALVTTTGAWLLVGELFGRDRTLQLAGAGLVGLLPMTTFLSASVTPDALLYASWAIVLWLGARVIERGLTAPWGWALAGATLVALATKGTSIALVPPVALVLVLGWRRRREGKARSRYARPLAVAAVLAAVVVGALALERLGGGELTFGNVNPSEVASYLWQFYLPPLSFMFDFPALPELPVYNVWLKDVAGRFGWLQVTQPEWLYPVLGIAALALAGVGGWALAARARRGLNRGSLLFLSGTSLLLIAGIHQTEYRLTIQQGFPFMQGRYLLPLGAVFAVFLAAALWRVPSRYRPVGAGLVLGCMLALQLVSFSRAAGFWFV